LLKSDEQLHSRSEASWSSNLAFTDFLGETSANNGSGLVNGFIALADNPTDWKLAFGIRTGQSAGEGGIFHENPTHNVPQSKVLQSIG
jgi:hypothetical protein